MGEGRQGPCGAQSRGHRVLAPAAFDIIGFDDYRVKLQGAKVMLDPAERRGLIARQAAALAGEAGVKVKDDAGLLDEVTGLVEWPQVLMGRVDAAFMDLPAEVLSTSMRSHQKYFSTETPDGRLADRFRSEEQTSELQSLMRISYADFCSKNKKNNETKYIRIADA